MARARRQVSKASLARRKAPKTAKAKVRMAKLLEEVSLESEKVMRSELDAERLPAELLTLHFKTR